MTNRFCILGAGGLAREIAALLPAGCVVFVRAEDEAAALAGEANIVLGMGSPSIRTKIKPSLDALPTYRIPNLIHESARLGINHLLGRGVVVCPGVVCTVNVAIDSYTLINLSCTIGHDTKIGQCCVINPGANISGDVTIDDGVLVGTNATILQGLHIGHSSIIGAGSVVLSDVPPGVTVVGVPAKTK